MQISSDRLVGQGQLTPKQIVYLLKIEKLNYQSTRTTVVQPTAWQQCLLLEV